MNVPAIFLANGNFVHPSLIGNNLVIEYVLAEGYCVIP